MDEDQWWAQQESDQRWLEEQTYADERTNQRTGGSARESAGRDHRRPERLGQPIFQVEVCRPRELLGCVPGRALEEWPLGDAVPDDRSHRDLAHDELIAFLGAVDAF